MPRDNLYLHWSVSCQASGNDSLYLILRKTQGFYYGSNTLILLFITGGYKNVLADPRAFGRRPFQLRDCRCGSWASWLLVSIIIVLSSSLPFQSIVVADVMPPKKSFFSRLKHLRGDHRAKDSEKSKRKDDDPQGGTVASPTASATSSKRIVSTSIAGGGIEPQPQDTPSNTQCAASIHNPATAISAIPPTSPTALHTPTASRTSTALSTAVASTLPSPSERLWDRAYDELKDKESKESKWMDAYEKIMTRILKKGDLSPTAPEPDENEIETDLAARRLQMNKLVEDGLKKTEKLANVMKGIGNAIRVIDSVKETIGKGIASVPYAGIAWAGVCIALQVSMSFRHCKYKY